MPSCTNQGPVLSIDGKNVHFEESSLTPTEYFLAKHSSFLDLGKEGDSISLSFLGVIDITGIKLYQNTSAGEMKLKTNESLQAKTELKKTPYQQIDRGRCYQCISYEQNGKTYYVGFAYGYHEVDSSTFNSFTEGNFHSVIVEKAVYSGGQSRKSSATIDDAAKIKRLQQSFEGAIIIATEKTLNYQTPGGGGGYSVITFSDNQKIACAIGEPDLFSFNGMTYSFIGGSIYTAVTSF